MTESIKKQLVGDLECEHILDCLYGSKELDIRCFEIIVNSDEPLSAQNIADKVDRDQSTVHRSLNRLIEFGIVEKEKTSLDSRGYKYIYSQVDSEKVTEDMRQLVDEWHDLIHNLIDSFEEKYE